MNKKLIAGVAEVTSPYDVPMAAAYMRADEFANLRVHNMINTIQKIVKGFDPSDSNIIDKVQKIYKSLAFRFDFILRTEQRRAFLYGKALGHKHNKKDSVDIMVSPKACEDCQQQKGRSIDLKHVGLDDMPIAHDNCKCDIG